MLPPTTPENFKQNDGFQVRWKSPEIEGGPAKIQVPC